MSYYLDTTGQPTLGIALCDRCRKKFPLAQLWPDPNSPGLMVCVDDRDQYDPYRLPARQSERINLPFVRPDEPVTGRQMDYGWALYSQYFWTQDTGWYILTEDGKFLQTEIAL
jgi:hypothetical protein